MLLLHSGGVLQGQISTAGDRYVVRRGQGEVNIAAAQVALVCGSLGEAYQQQRSQLSSAPEAHITLAEWCLRYDLLAEAQRELTEARRLDSRSPQLLLLERRLAVATRPPTPRPTPAPAAGPDVVTEPAAAEPLANSSHEQRRLEATSAELPAGALERFSRKVQPIVVNSCTTSGCHRPGGPENFQLDRAVLFGQSNRRTTLRNLTATLALVDHQTPLESPLLTVPRRTHGGMKGPLFGPRQEELVRQLAVWIALVTNTQSEQTEEEGEFAPTGLDEAQPIAARKRGRAPRVPIQALPLQAAGVEAAAEYEWGDGSELELAEWEEAGTLRPAVPPRFGVEAAAWQPRDPFDPELFNRQTQARGQTAPRRFDAESGAATALPAAH